MSGLPGSYLVVQLVMCLLEMEMEVFTWEGWQSDQKLNVRHLHYRPLSDQWKSWESECKVASPIPHSKPSLYLECTIRTSFIIWLMYLMECSHFPKYYFYPSKGKQKEIEFLSFFFPLQYLYHWQISPESSLCVYGLFATLWQDLNTVTIFLNLV